MPLEHFKDISYICYIKCIIWVNILYIQEVYIVKFSNVLKSIFISLRQSLKRFPVTIGISTLLTIILIYLNENRIDMTTLEQERLLRLSMVLGIGILLSLCIDLLKENLFKENKTKTILSYFVGLAILVFYYMFLLKEFEFVPMTRYVGTLIFLTIAYFYIPVIGNKDRNYEYRVIDIFGNFFETVIYSLVILLGIFAIFITIDNLFDLDINYKYYLYVFIITVFIFAVSFFLSKQPIDGKFFDEKKYSQSIKILLTYIVIPLITIYTIILYIYFAKIFITWEWPKGLVSHLVIWYTALSIGVIFLITPLVETDRISKYFKMLFPKFVLPILLMMFLSIGQRVYQYGVTENRYFILVLGLWITFVMLYFSIKKPLKNIIIPISLSVIVINSVFGPLSSYSISKFSQNRRLDEILSRNFMIYGGEIVKNSDISSEDQREISNIVNYFDNNHDLKDINILADDFSTDDMEKVFGFNYIPNIWGSPLEERYFYYATDLHDKPIDIAGYEHYIQIGSWSDRVEIGDLIIIKDRDSYSLSIQKNQEIIIEMDIKDIAQEIIGDIETELEYEKGQINPDDMDYEIEEDYIKLKIIFTNISGVESDNNIDYSSIEYIVLVKDLTIE